MSKRKRSILDAAVRERVTTSTGGSKSGYKRGALTKQREEASVKGHHNGRPHPPSLKLGGDDNAAGASNGGEHNAQNTNKYVSE